MGKRIGDLTGHGDAAMIFADVSGEDQIYTQAATRLGCSLGTQRLSIRGWEKVSCSCRATLSQVPVQHLPQARKNVSIQRLAGDLAKGQNRYALLRRQRLL